VGLWVDNTLGWFFLIIGNERRSDTRSSRNQNFEEEVKRRKELEESRQIFKNMRHDDLHRLPSPALAHILNEFGRRPLRTFLVFVPHLAKDPWRLAALG
jgi:hypothetical protein